jgi:hypothetical protein
LLADVILDQVQDFDRINKSHLTNNQQP